MAHLYILTHSDREDIVEVGRSDDPDSRCRQLQASQPCFIRVAATLPFQGGLEREVHRRLRTKRVSSGAGRERFQASVAEALQVATEVLDNTLERFDACADNADKRWTGKERARKRSYLAGRL